MWIVVEKMCSCLLQQISSNRKPTAGFPVSPVLRNYDGFCCATHCILMNTSPEIPGYLSDTLAASSVNSLISPSSLREEEAWRGRVFSARRAPPRYIYETTRAMIHGKSRLMRWRITQTLSAVNRSKSTPISRRPGSYSRIPFCLKTSFTRNIITFQVITA